MRLLAKISMSAILFLIIFSAKSQEFYESVNPISTESNTLNHKLTGSQYYFRSTLNGTVYLYDDWLPGTVLLENGDRFENVYLKLNTLSEELIHYNKRTGSIIILDSYLIDEFEIQSEHNSNQLFRKIYFDKYPKGEHYYNVIYDGIVKLLIWHRTSEVKISAYKDDLGYLRDSEFVPDEVYFIVFPGNDIVKMTYKRRAFINMFPDQKRTIRKLFRKNKIRFYLGTGEIIRAVQLIEEEFFSE